MSAPTQTAHYIETADWALSELGIQPDNHGVSDGLSTQASQQSRPMESLSPVDGRSIARVDMAAATDFEAILDEAQRAFTSWREWPAPARGEVVRQIGEALRENKEALGTLVAYEMGKIKQEGLGEVQEIIDICDFAVGQSRMLYGKTMKSERPSHRLYEQWQPLGTVGIITAFNFPVAVWGWNTMIAAICGNCVIWKPSEKTPLCGIALYNLIRPILQANNVPAGVFNLVCGEREVGQAMAQHPGLNLVSATGSIPMGQSVGQEAAARLGRSLLELGGNNAIILTPSADLQLAQTAIVFSAVGTCGQRCTSTRRLIVHDDIYDKVKEQLISAYRQLQERIGNPLEPDTLIGPLIDTEAVENMQNTLKEVQAEGGKLLVGGDPTEVGDLRGGHYVQPAVVEAENHYASVQRETFAPILYLLRYQDIDEAIALQNGVVQGLSSSIFSQNLREVERFLSASGSDCGIANVNIGPSGAEIGGAFGGEKETGGGRESGSDAWKAYMRRQTVTINYSEEMPLAQGISFDF